MNNKKHNLFNFFETLKSDANFNTLKERIGNYAKININTKDGKKINIYSAELFYLLSSEDYKDEGFINAYAKGYHNGNEFIENKTQKALNGFFKSCPEKYIDELKVFYFDKAPNEILSYKQIAKSCPINFYIDNIEKIGFASGVINAIDLMNIENPSLFEKFYEATPQQTETVKNDEVTKYNWFIIGLKFANGEMKALLKTHNNNATKIATELGNKDGFRPYISESIGVKKHTSEKSIYSDYDKMKTIIEYCKDEKTEIQSEFLMYFNKLEQEQ